MNFAAGSKESCLGACPLAVLLAITTVMKVCLRPRVVAKRLQKEGLCRICQEKGDLGVFCDCKGSLAVHQSCLQRWVDLRRSSRCELCRAEYEVHSGALRCYLYAVTVLSALCQQLKTTFNLKKKT